MPLQRAETVREREDAAKAAPRPRGYGGAR